MMQHPVTTVFLLGIIALTICLRVYRLADVPFGFFADEAAIGYNAYTLLTTGRDEHGEPFPVFFRSFGDYKPPIPIYVTVPFVAAFGLTELSVKLPSVTWGVLTIVLLYLLGAELGSRAIGLWAAFLGATMPWLIHYNRTGFDCNAYVALFTAAVYLFVTAASRPMLLIPAFVVLGLTFYTYQPAKLTVPLLALSILLVYRRELVAHKTLSSVGLVAFALISIPLAASFLTGEATARFALVSILSAAMPVEDVARRMVDNYVTHLSPTFLFTEGDRTPLTRHFVGGITPLLAASSPFLLLGLITLIRTRRQRISQLLILWLLLIYPIAGVVVAEPPFTTRSMIGAPLFALLLSLGIAAVLGRARSTSVALVAAILINVFLFSQFYLIRYPLYSSGYSGWQSGAREILRYFTSHQADYDEMFMQPAFNEAGFVGSC